MAHDIEIAGATYSGVPGIAVPKAAGGGAALYLDADGYVTLGTSQTVTGSKTFAGGITVSGGATVSGGMVVSGGITGSCTSAGTATNAASLGSSAASAYAKAAAVVTLSGSQTISGSKTFASGITASNGLTVNGGITLDLGGDVPTHIPATVASNQSRFLRGDGVWADVDSAASAGQLASPPSIAVDLSKEYDSTTPYTFPGNQGRIAIPVRNTLPQSQGGTGASSRLGAVKALFNDNLSAGATSFLCVASNWASAGFASVDNTKSALGITAAGISSTLGTTAVASATNAGTAASCTGNAATATTAASCTGNAATATNATSLGGVAAASYALAADYLPKTGGTLTGNLSVSKGGANTSMWIDNGATTSGTVYRGAVGFIANTNGNHGVYDFTPGSAGWLLRKDSAGAISVAGTAANASSLGGVAAANYVQKTVNIQRGSAALYTSGQSVNAGLVTSKTAKFASAFTSAPHVMAIVRGAANSFAAGQNVAVQSVTTTSAVFVVRSTYANAITTSAASYIDWVAVYI